MLFGFSVGDFITVGKLIADIVTSLRTASIAEYRELLCELHGLQRALHEIEHMKCTPGQEATINGVKVAALMCQYPLDDFSAKLKRFEGLGISAGKTRSRLETIKLWTRKLQWGFCMKEEVEKLRMYIVVHVGSLNMRLITQGLVLTSFAAEQADRGRAALEGRLEDAQKLISQTHRSLDLHNTVVQNNESILKNLSKIITGDIVSQLKTLRDLASKIWDSNLQVIGFMISMQTSIGRPDSRFTWVQEPIRFEDALGRVIPVPSEYNCRKLEAIIEDQFREGLGHQKVSAGEYELFNSYDSSKAICLSEEQSLTPGMAITMAIVYGYYEVVLNEAGGMSCLVCTAWFDLARKTLSRPLRPPIIHHQETHERTGGVSGTKRKRDVTDVGELADTQQLHLQLRTERKRFKNVRVHFTKLPEAPSFRSGRSLSPAAEFGQLEAPIVNLSAHAINAPHPRAREERYYMEGDDILNDDTGNKDPGNKDIENWSFPIVFRRPSSRLIVRREPNPGVPGHKRRVVAKGLNCRERREREERWERERWESRKDREDREDRVRRVRELSKRIKREHLELHGHILSHGCCAKAAQAPPGAPPTSAPLEHPQNPPGGPSDLPPEAPPGVPPE